MTSGPAAWAALPRNVRNVVLLVLACAVGGGLRASLTGVGGDFLRYHRAGRLVATGNSDRIYDPEWLRDQRVYAEERAADRAARGDQADDYEEAEFKYLPATAVLMAPFGALHPRTGWILWGAWNGALIAVTFAAAWSFATQRAEDLADPAPDGDGPPRPPGPGFRLSWRWMLLPAIVLFRAANNNHNLGQLNPSAIAPATVAIWALSRRRDASAGVLAAYGTAMKFIPVILGLWFVVKRRWRALAALAAGAVAFIVVLPVAVLGPSRTNTLMHEYVAARAHVYTEAAPKDLPGHSVKSFVYRVFGGTHYLTGSGAKHIDWDLSVMHADPAVLRWVVLGIVAALLVFVLRAGWGPLRGAGDPRGPPEAGLLFCALLLASPEARAPHFLYLALPLTVLTYSLVRAWHERWRHRRAATALAIAAAVLLNLDAEKVLGRDAAETLSAYCILGWATLVAGAALVLVLRGCRAAEAAAPPA